MLEIDKKVPDSRVIKLKDTIKKISFFLTAATFILMIFTLIAWIYSKNMYSPAKNFYYFMALMMNFYFPYLFLNIFADIKSSKEKLQSEKPEITKQDIYAISFSYIHPIILLIIKLIISWRDFNATSYFFVTLISVGFINSIAIGFAFKFYEEKRDKILLSMVLTSCAIFAITMLIVRPFSIISRPRYTFRVILLIGVLIISLIARSSKGSEKKEESKSRKNSNEIKKRLEKQTTNLWIIFVILIVIFQLPFFLINIMGTRYPFLAMRTDSMEPYIKRGDLLIIVGQEPRNIKNGSIIVYNPRGLTEDPGRLVIHRVIEIINLFEGYYQFITKGDANEVADTDPVDGNRVVGIVIFKFSNLGWALIAYEDWRLQFYLLFISVTILVYIPINYSSEKKKLRKLLSNNQENQIDKEMRDERNSDNP